MPSTNTETDVRRLPRYDLWEDTGTHDPYVVILYNDDYHSVDEVVEQLLKATSQSMEKCVLIMLEAHTTGGPSPIKAH